jgi:23S rRNA (adenine2030-N6)-methyltransferase
MRAPPSGCAAGKLRSAAPSGMAALDERPLPVTLPRPMNYRHAFHAGNFADVVKHALLARVIAHLCRKDTAFRVIDTHAGAGMTDLDSDEARRGAEWQDGIGRVWQHPFAPATAALLAPYLSAIAAYNPGSALKRYPGSPLLIRQWLRPQDRLIACELEPGAARALSRNLHGDTRIKAIAIDGWTALNAYIPPKEKRGLVLIDPPYEREDEFRRAADAVGAAQRKWPVGTILLWYPVKDQRDIARFTKQLAGMDLAKSLQIQLSRTGATGTKLRGTGLIVVNAPWTLQAEAQILLPALANVFWPDEGNDIRIAPLSPL